jgi:hypothetical protein
MSVDSKTDNCMTEIVVSYMTDDHYGVRSCNLQKDLKYREVFDIIYS